MIGVRIRNKGKIKSGGIPAEEIALAYIKKFNVKWWERLFGITVMAFEDPAYLEADPALIQDVLDKDFTDKQEYIPEEKIRHFDCGDFTNRLMGAFHCNIETASMPIFKTWITGHSLLSYYHKGEIWFIEPQNDIVFSPQPNWKLIHLCD